jgi:hypothetical protein
MIHEMLSSFAADDLLDGVVAHLLSRDDISWADLTSAGNKLAGAGWRQMPARVEDRAYE